MPRTPSTPGSSPSPRGRARPRAAKKAAPALTRPATQASTTTRLLDAAEVLFIERGYANVPLRDIVSAAGANLGAIPYHFGTKQNLFKAVLERRVGPIQAARRERMQALLLSGRTLEVEQIIRAQIEPAFRASSESVAYRRLTGYAVVDHHPEVRKIVSAVLDAQEPLMPKLLRQACPHLSDDEFFWRLYCVYGAMVYIQVDNGRMQRILRRDVDTTDLMPVIEHVVDFLTRGFIGERRARPRGRGAARKR
jgi:AcrR family transcriptional regulator